METKLYHLREETTLAVTSPHSELQEEQRCECFTPVTVLNSGQSHLKPIVGWISVAILTQVELRRACLFKQAHQPGSYQAS